MQRKKEYLSRYTVIFIIFAVGALVFLFRLVNVQIAGQDYYTMSTPSKTYTREVTVQAHRGEIYDRNGIPLVENTYIYELMLDYSDMPSSNGDKNALILKLISRAQANSPDALTMPSSPYTFITTDDGQTLNCEYISAYFNTAKGTRLNRLFGELSVDGEPSSVTSAKLLQRYGITDRDGRLNYSAADAEILLVLRLDMELSDFSPSNPYCLLSDIDVKMITLIEEDTREGVYIRTQVKREYKYPGYASHIIGRVGRIQGNTQYYTDLGYPLDAIVGLTGAEQAFESYLRGIDGKMTVTEDEYGNVISKKITKQPVAGCDIYLTIDIELQIASEDALASNITFIRSFSENDGILLNGEDASAGALSAISVKTGEVLALASNPTFNLATFSEDWSELSQNSLSPMFNRALEGMYEPGSTFKLGVAAIALTEGIIGPNTVIQTLGEYKLYDDFKPRCWIYLTDGYSTHGTIDVTEAIRVSCNYFFYDVGRRLTIDVMNAYCRKFGLGQATGIELTEKKGVLAGPDYRIDNGLDLWSPGDTLQAAIGQSDNTFSPLQISVYLSTLLNNGERYRATILKRVTDNSGTEVYYEAVPEVVDSAGVSEEACTVVKNAMKQVLEYGTAATMFNDFGVEIGGKTGTAQVSKKKSNNAIFTAFAPFAEPEIAVTCIIEQGSSGIYAGYAVRDVFAAYFGLDGTN